MPKVSIIVPVRNRERLLQETLESVSAQTFADWECVVVDDGSTDHAFEVAQERSLMDSRFKVQRRQGSEGNADVCRNQGFAASAGEYVVFLDSDDLLARTCLEQRVRFMDLHTDLDFAVFPGEIFASVPGDLGEPQNSSDGVDDIAASLTLNHPWGTFNPIWRREALLKVGPWDEELVKWQDVEFHIRALARGLRYERSPLRDVYCRVGDQAAAEASHRSRGSPEALRNADCWLGKVEECLREEGVWNPDRRRGLAALHFWFAERWCEKADLPRALRTWRSAAQRQLVGCVTQLQGALLLLLLRHRRFVPGFDWLCPVSRWKRRKGLLTAY